MKQALIYFVISLLLVACGGSKSLFNGKDFSGWHIDVPDMDKDQAVQSPFLILDGKMVSLAAPQGHIITDKIYRNYRLQVEYRFPAKPGNCGVLVHASDPRVLYGMFPRSIEAQLMHENAGDFWVIGEDIVVPDMEARRGPKEKWGNTEGALRRIPNLTDGSENALGEWNTMVVECVDRSIKVWINGELVNYGYDCTTDHGQIALQAEGAEVEFRKVVLQKIKKLSE